MRCNWVAGVVAHCFSNIVVINIYIISSGGLIGNGPSLRLSKVAAFSPCTLTLSLERETRLKLSLSRGKLEAAFIDRASCHRIHLANKRNGIDPRPRWNAPFLSRRGALDGLGSWTATPSPPIENRADFHFVYISRSLLKFLSFRQIWIRKTRSTNAKLPGTLESCKCFPWIYIYMYILKYRASLSSILSSISPTAKIGTVGGGTVVPHQLSSF